jgi:malate dehydrogenase
VTTSDGGYSIVQDLEIDEDCRRRMQVSYEELLEERSGVAELL